MGNPKVPAKYEYKHPWRRAANKSVLWGEWVAFMIAAMVSVVVYFLAGLLGVDDPGNRTYIAVAAMAVFLILGVGDLVRVRYRLQIDNQQTENVALHLRVEEVDKLRGRVADLERALDYGFQVPVKLEVLKQYAPSVRATMIGDWLDDLVNRAKAGDVHAKTHIPSVAAALMDTIADWGASPARAKVTARVESAMQDLGLPWTRPLEPGE